MKIEIGDLIQINREVNCPYASECALVIEIGVKSDCIFMPYKILVSSGRIVKRFKEEFTLIQKGNR